MSDAIFSIDHNEIFSNCVDIYQAETDYTLERQDAERLVFKIFAAQMHGLGSRWIDASRQIFLKYMTDTQLDDYGEFFGIPRLTNTASKSVVRFTFTDTIELATIIYRNTIITGSNANGTFTFKVLEDTFVETGIDYLDIEVVEFIDSDTNSGALANDIEIDDLNTLDDTSFSYSFVDSVTNVVESSGGLASELDDNFRDRLFLGPNKYSTAGVSDAYKFHALSASADIISVGLTKVNWEILLWLLPKNYDGAFNLNLIGDSASQLDNIVLSGLSLSNTDDGKLYWNLTDAAGTRSLIFYSDSAKTTSVAQYVGADGLGVVIAEVGGSGLTGTIDLAYTADDTDTTNEVLTSMQEVAKVYNLLYPASGDSQIRPLNDIVIPDLATKQTFTISSVAIEINSNNINSITNKTLQIINTYIDNVKNKAGTDVVRSKLSGPISSLEGVNDVTVEFNSDSAISKITAAQSEVYFGTFSASNLTVTVAS